MEIIRNDIRNIAIIAHVDHGKTTLVDEMLKQSGVFRENQVVHDRVMDSNDIERERGITILAKNTAVDYNGVHVNIVDTPGHADFGGEVERVLKMVDGVLLLVDSFEGPMPQTRFVLQKALELGHKAIIVINKIDRADARPQEVIDEVLDLFIDLGAGEEQLECPFIYASARQGTATLDLDTPGKDLRPLFDTILEYIPAPKGDAEGPTQALISTIDYNDYVGRIGIGRVERGVIRKGMMCVRANLSKDEVPAAERVSALYRFNGLERQEIEEAKVGDIIAVSGFPEIHIGDTLCPQDNIEPLPFVRISEPTIAVTFKVNDSPFAGKEGKYVTSRHLRARLMREMLTDVSLRVEDTEFTDSFKVSGRGELHITVLIENMRRQGYEFAVSKPVVLFKEIDGKRCEPIEKVVVDVPAVYMGGVMETLGNRRAVVTNIVNGDRVRMEFSVPSRGLFGYRNEFMTQTRGEGIMSSVYDGYEPYKGDIATRISGSLVAYETGTSVRYGLFYAQDRGEMFITPGESVYTGMVVGRNSRPGDIEVNVCKEKQVTNMRNSAAAEDAMRLRPVRPMTLEFALDFMDDDELIEITPKNIRIRKAILDSNQRMRANRKKNQE
ncbi:MAG: translational GTPase TypA [Clostridiales bacterium]|nr:translational GTPase TypA [Clostridiales bacterium]MBQ2817771.1 translational GTPase TypA [Clostridia bacterium]